MKTSLAKKAGHTKTTAHTGAVTLIQRFGSAPNLNVHQHMPFLMNHQCSHLKATMAIKMPGKPHHGGITDAFSIFPEQSIHAKNHLGDESDRQSQHSYFL